MPGKEPILYARQDGQNHEREDSGEYRGDLATETGRDADRGREPDTRSRSKPHDLLLMSVVQDRSSAEEANPGDNTLDDTRGVPGVSSRLLRHEDEERRAERDEHVRPHSGRLASLFALEPDHAGKDRGKRQAHRDSRRLGHVRDIGKVLSNRLPHRLRVLIVDPLGTSCGKSPPVNFVGFSPTRLTRVALSQMVTPCHTPLPSD